MTSAQAWPDIAARLRPLAKASRGSQKRLALRFGLDEYEVSRYLNGKAVPDPIVGMKLALALGVDLAEEAGLGSPGSVQAVVARSGDGEERELHGIGAPLVAENVAAGDGSFPSVPDEKVYFFHESFLRKFGWRESDRDRFCCIRLGSARVASSMIPTIHPRSVLLVDRKAPREHLRPRSIWLVDDPDDGVCVKRVTLRDGSLILESDNPDAHFAPRYVALKDRPLQTIARAKVIWWGVEASAHGG